MLQEQRSSHVVWRTHALISCSCVGKLVSQTIPIDLHRATYTRNKVSAESVWNSLKIAARWYTTYLLLLLRFVQRTRESFPVHGSGERISLVGSINSNEFQAKGKYLFASRFLWSFRCFPRGSTFGWKRIDEERSRLRGEKWSRCSRWRIVLERRKEG